MTTPRHARLWDLPEPLPPGQPTSRRAPCPLPGEPRTEQSTCENGLGHDGCPCSRQNLRLACLADSCLAVLCPDARPRRGPPGWLLPGSCSRATLRERVGKLHPGLLG